MPDFHYQDYKDVALHLVDNTIVGNSDAPHIGHPCQPFATGRSRVFSKYFDPDRNPPLNMSWQPLQLAKSRWFELNGIIHWPRA
jgi:hypothetical protein